MYTHIHTYIYIYIYIYIHTHIYVYVYTYIHTYAHTHTHTHTCIVNDTEIVYAQPRGSSGEHSAAVGGKWDISNKQRIGLSEVQLVQKMIDGISKIIEIEETLASNAGMTPMQALAKCQ